MGAKTVEQIYAIIPKLDCQRKCRECCGPITVFGVEWDRMQAASLVSINKINHRAECPALSGNSCSIYSVRPLICRLWGVVRAMRCPWGCEPERWLSDVEVDIMFRTLKRLSHSRTESTL
jgi:Fe-S-cluster containining protein